MMNMNKIIFIMLLFLFINSSVIFAVNPVSASGLVEDSWNKKTPMTYDRHDVGTVAVGGKVYAIGGFRSDGCTGEEVNSTECYNPETNKWTTLRSMPTPRSDFAIAAYQNKIYCIGNGRYNIGVNEVYDIATDSWSTKASAPISGWCSQAYVTNEKIYVTIIESTYEKGLNGANEHKYTTHLYMYDPTKDTWTEKTNIPFQITVNNCYFISTIADDKIIVMGTFYIDASRKEETKVLVYNPKTDRWAENKPVPDGVFPTYGLPVVLGVTSGIYAPQRVYILSEITTYVYDPIDDMWTTAKSPQPHGYSTGVMLDDILYITGQSGNKFWSPEAVANVFMEYIPIGYSSTPIAESTLSQKEISLNSTLNTSFTDKISLSNPLVIALLMLSIGIIAASLFYVVYKKKRT
jgi:N-acetylneuraminic acid mutarotase